MLNLGAPGNLLSWSPAGGGSPADSAVETCQGEVGREGGPRIAGYRDVMLGVLLCVDVGGAAGVSR
jgi:hypothetical protein